MAGARSECTSIVQQQAPMAICAAHRLNLAVVTACKIQAIKNAESYIGEVFPTLDKKAAFTRESYRMGNPSSSFKETERCM